MTRVLIPLARGCEELEAVTVIDLLRRAQIEVVVPGLSRVDGQLHHRDVGCGEHVRQHRPTAVVEPPRVEVLAHPPRLDHLGDLLGQLRQARRRILEIIEPGDLGEEVVDRARPRHRGHRGRVDVPVRGDDQDGAWPRDRLTE